jgi:hypothetical protein
VVLPLPRKPVRIVTGTEFATPLMQGSIGEKRYRRQWAN